MSIDVEQIRLELELERERLRAAIAGVEHPSSLTEETGDLSIGMDDHIADTATEAYMRELDEGLGANAQHLLAEIQTALGRIEDGTYGICAACGHPIDAERLEAVPYTTLCLEHKREQERR